MKFTIPFQIKLSEMRVIISLLLLSILPVQGYGQKNSYFAGKDFKSVNVKIIDLGDKSNSRLCTVKKGKTEVRLSPYEIEEYGFNDGRVYVSKNVNVRDSVQRVFLLRVYKGNRNVYYLREKHGKTYFIEEDSSKLVAIPKHSGEESKSDYHDQLLTLTHDCPNVQDAAKVAGYHRRSMKKLFERYESCELKPFPMLRYGFMAGYGLSCMVSGPHEDVNIQELDFSYEGNFTAGLFLDAPIMMSDFSLHLEASYNKIAFSYHDYSTNKDLDLIASISSLKLPVLIRYSYPSNKLRPYVNAGPCATYTVKNDSKLYMATHVGDQVEIADVTEPYLFSDYRLGYALGIGCEYKVSYRRFLFLDMRYDRLYGFKEKNSMGMSEFFITAGINL
jgi:outer membrane protein W